MSTKLSKKLERINSSVSKIRQKTNMPDAVIEDLATAVESMVTPEGSITITENSTVDVSNYAEAIVNVSGGGSPTKSNIYRVTSIEERDAITDMVDGDMCVVLGENEKIAITDASQTFKEISFPNSITSAGLAVVNFEYIGVISGNTLLRCSKNMRETTLTITINTPIYSGTLTYKGRSNGTTEYSIESTTGNINTNMIIDLGETVKCTAGSLTTYAQNVLKETYKPTIFGIYKFISNHWVNATIGVSVDTANVLNNVEVFTNDGLLSGTFPDNTTASNVILNNAIGKFKNEIGQPTSLAEAYYRNKSIINFEVGVFMDVSKCTSFKSMFSSASNLVSANVENWDMSSAQDISYMFHFCDNLEKLDVSKWDVSNVTTMAGALYGLKKIKNLDVSNWNTSKVTDMNSLFGGCYLLENINVSKWDTRNVTTLSSFLNANTVMQEIDLSNFNTDKVTTFSYMFQNSTALKRIDMRNATLNSCTDTRCMFYGCTVLEYLDIRNFEFTSTLTNYSNMFYNVPANCLIIVKDSAARNWIKAQRSDFTNIKTVAEYEG